MGNAAVPFAAVIKVVPEAVVNVPPATDRSMELVPVDNLPLLRERFPSGSEGVALKVKVCAAVRLTVRFRSPVLLSSGPEVFELPV